MSRKKNPNAPFCHSIIASLATYVENLCPPKCIIRHPFSPGSRATALITDCDVVILLMGKCKFFNNSQTAKFHHFIWMQWLSCFSPLCGVVERCCGLSKYVACQRKHKYVPSCNLLGELVIIEKLKPANCVCTKTKLLL